MAGKYVRIRQNPMEDMVEEMSNDNVDMDSTGMQSEQKLLEIRRDQLYYDLNRNLLDMLNDGIFDTFNRGQILAKNKRIDNYFNEYAQVHRDYCVLYPDNSNDAFVHLEQLYDQVLAKIIMSTQDNIPNGNILSSTRMDHGEGPSTLHFEMPQPPRVGKFSGKQSEWIEFRDRFLAQVHDKDHISAVDKMTYLQEACEGNAKLRLGPWPPTKEGYDSAWQSLLEAYDDQYSNVHGIIECIDDKPPQLEDDYESINFVLSRTIGGMRQLATLMPDKNIYTEQLHIHICLQNLHPRTVDSWKQYRHKENLPLPTFHTFQKFLETRMKGRRDTGNTLIQEHYKELKDRHSRSRVNPYSKTEKNHDYRTLNHKRDNDKSPSIVNQCRVCQGSHPIYLCEKFKKMDLNQRESYVIKYRYCFCCLNVGHVSHGCKYPSCKKCPDDSRRHHYLLCRKNHLTRDINSVSMNNKTKLKPNENQD